MDLDTAAIVEQDVGFSNSDPYLKLLYIQAESIKMMVNLNGGELS